MIEFGEKVEPLVDYYLVEYLNQVSFQSQSPVRLQKVLGFDMPWEGPGSLGNVVFEDNGIIKMYYRGYPYEGTHDTDSHQTTCLAVSEDGLNFERYPVNKICYNEITENNIIRMDSYSHNFLPFIDTNPACKPSEKYKAMAGTVYQGGLHAFSSPDGIHWTEMTDGPVLTDGLFDSMNVAFWDPLIGKYRSFSRYFTGVWTFSGVTVPGLRAIQSSVSDDFLNWAKPTHHIYTWEDGPEPTENLYTNATTPIPGAEHILVSIPMRFQEGRTALQGYNDVGISDAILMTSRDGIHWDRSIHDAWITGGFYDHEWTQRNFIVCPGIIERGNDFLFYVEQNYMWDDDGIWAYSIPRYRFMSLYADSAGGTVLTKTLSFLTDDIYLNFSTSAFGYVIVKVLDQDGNDIYCSEELFGNELSRPLHIDGLTGQAGRLQIELKEAHLYAIGSTMIKS